MNEYENETNNEQTTGSQPNAQCDADVVPQIAGFRPPDKAVRGRIRRLNVQTGGWEDCRVLLDGVPTSIVDAESCSPNLQLVELLPVPHRITWYAANNQRVGYSNTWKPVVERETEGGASNTPLLWPPVGDNGHAVPSRAGLLSAQDSILYMRGIAQLAHEITGPIVSYVHVLSENALARERAFHDSRMAMERQAHEAAAERDRAFLAAISQASDRKLEQLEQRLQLATQPAPDDVDEDEDEDEDGDEDSNPATNPWDVANAFVENAPELVRTVAKEWRTIKEGESVVNGAADVVAEGVDVSSD